MFSIPFVVPSGRMVVESSTLWRWVIFFYKHILQTNHMTTTYIDSLTIIYFLQATDKLLKLELQHHQRELPLFFFFSSFCLRWYRCRTGASAQLDLLLGENWYSSFTKNTLVVYWSHSLQYWPHVSYYGNNIWGYHPKNHLCNALLVLLEV